MPGDLQDRTTCEQVVADAVEGLGSLNILVNNAGYHWTRDGDGLDGLTPEHVERTLRTNLDAVLCFLEGYTGAQVRAFARVLGEVGAPRAVRYLVAALGHRNAGLRMEAVAALAKIGGEPAWRAIAGLLVDADETVRCRAAYFLGETGGEIARNALLLIVTAPGFRRRSPEEARVFITALSGCGGPQVTAALQQLARAGGWLDRRTTAVIRQCARQALAVLEPAAAPPARSARQLLGGLFSARPHREAEKDNE